MNGLDVAGPLRDVVLSAAVAGESAVVPVPARRRSSRRRRLRRRSGRDAWRRFAPLERRRAARPAAPGAETGLIHDSSTVATLPAMQPKTDPLRFDRFAEAASEYVIRGVFFAACVVLLVVWAPSYSHSGTSTRGSS